MSVGAELGQQAYILQTQFKKIRDSMGGGVWTPPLGTPVGLRKATAKSGQPAEVNVWPTRQ